MTACSLARKGKNPSMALDPLCAPSHWRAQASILPEEGGRGMATVGRVPSGGALFTRWVGQSLRH